jgi:hypothetical protein
MPIANGRPSRIEAGGRADAGTAVDALMALSGRVSRLTPDRRDPERFHVEKSEVAGELRRLAYAMRVQANRRRLPS